MLHVEPPNDTKPSSTPGQSTPNQIPSHPVTTVPKSCSHTLLVFEFVAHKDCRKTCRAFLDSASPTSFISERLTQSLCLPRMRLQAMIAGIVHDPTSQAFTELSISPVHDPSAVIIPQVTSVLPV